MPGAKIREPRRTFPSPLPRRSESGAGIQALPYVSSAERSRGREILGIDRREEEAATAAFLVLRTVKEEI